MRHATCDKIALCKRAYLCDMRLLHAVAGKLKSFNFLATIACRNKPVYIVRFWRMSHGRMFLSHRVNAPLGHTRRQIAGTCCRDKSRRMHHAKSCRGDKILFPQHVAWIQDDLNSCDMLRWQKYVSRLVTWEIISTGEMSPRFVGASGFGVAFLATGLGWVLKCISFWHSNLPYLKKFQQSYQVSVSAKYFVSRLLHCHEFSSKI